MALTVNGITFNLRVATGLYIKGLRFSEISPPASTSTTKKEKKYILH